MSKQNKWDVKEQYKDIKANFQDYMGLIPRKPDFVVANSIGANRSVYLYSLTSTFFSQIVVIS